MKILLVEDQVEFAEVLITRLNQQVAGCDVRIARSRAAALNEIDTQRFDVIICDLRIPTVDDALDAELAHGQAVYVAARQQVPGTPVLVLSAHGDRETVASMAVLAPHDDPFGSGVDIPMLRYAVKTSDLATAMAAISDAATQLSALEEVDLSPRPAHYAVPPDVGRVMRVFGRRQRGVVVRMEGIGGGLTDAMVFRVRVEDAKGALVALVVAKVADLQDVDDEVERYQRSVAILPSSVFTPLVTTVRAGAGHMGGAFYTLEEAYGETLFALAKARPDVGGHSVRRLLAGTHRWRDGRGAQSVAIRTIRERLCPEATFNAEVKPKFDGVPWQAVEERTIQVRLCPQHCDLHGLNVLVTDAGEARMIDFGSVAEGPAALDPVTLELSLIFHPDGPARESGWPSTEEAERWVDFESYAGGTPLANYMRPCRDWAFDQAASNAEVFATAYAYATRQLTYEDTEDELALAVIRACCRELVGGEGKQRD